ncbi:MAG: hypothetical protein AAF685_08175 [Cyanobacteria bacterium P01_C01_bin.89]
MKPYKPSGKAPASGIMRLGLSTVIGNIVAGGLIHLLGRLIYVILVFPLLMGATAGGLAFAASYGGKIRNPLLTVAAGLLGGLCIYGTTHGADYVVFRSESGARVDELLEERVGESGFVGYLKYSAQQGVSIGKIGRDGINLGETGTWVYWLIELAIIEMVAGAIAYGAASQVFCEKCSEWYDSATPIGGVSPEKGNVFLEALKAQNFSQAAQSIGPVLSNTNSSLKISHCLCPACREEGEILLSVAEDRTDKNGNNLWSKTVKEELLTPREYQQFMAAIPTQSADSEQV